jgi:hypothetical protein
MFGVIARRFDKIDCKGFSSISKRKMKKWRKKFWARLGRILGVGIGGRISQFSGLLGVFLDGVTFCLEDYKLHIYTVE